MTPKPALLALLILLTALSCAILACASDSSDDDVTPTSVAATASMPAGSPEPGATTQPEATANADEPVPPIAWSACPSGPFECAEYEVPLDYEDALGESITLAVRRLAAEEPDERIGLLFANPGGPGGSTIDILSQWTRNLPDPIRSRFDIILFDPRGVGNSSPLICHDNIQELMGLNPYPETNEDWRIIQEAIQRQVDQCEGVGPDILPFLGTTNVARDMDRLRTALGEETITYIGYSYGTTLGQVYADLFPTRVRAMVLDGGVDVSLSSDERAGEQTLGFEAAFQRYLQYCRERSCIAGDPEAVIKDLIAEAALDPIPAPRADRPAGAGEALYAIVQSMYTPIYRPILTAAINGALDGDASGLIYLTDAYAGRNNDGTYSNGSEANSAVNCLDYETERDPAHHRLVSEDFAEVAPFFGPAIGQLGLFCALWPVDPQPLAVPQATGAPPIMVIGGTGDPATPYKWSVALASQLESGFLVTNDAEGHTAYNRGVGCIDDAVDAYILDLTIPTENLTCGDAGITPVPAVP